MKRYLPFILVVGDVLALLLFVAIGQRDHEMVNPENPIGGLLLTGGEFVLPWIVVGWLVGAFGPSASDNIQESGQHFFAGRPSLLRGLNTWLIVAPLGILFRAALLGRSIIPTIFMVVVMGLGGAFVIGWRLLFLFVLWLGQHRNMEAKTSGTG